MSSVDTEYTSNPDVIVDLCTHCHVSRFISVKIVRFLLPPKEANPCRMGEGGKSHSLTYFMVIF